MKETFSEKIPSSLKVRRNPFAAALRGIRENPNCQVEETTLEKSGAFPSGWLRDDNPEE